MSTKYLYTNKVLLSAYFNSTFFSRHILYSSGSQKTSKWKINKPGIGNIRERERETKKQAGAELCQAQAQVGLTAEAELILMLSSMEAVFHIFKTVLD